MSIIRRAFEALSLWHPTAESETVLYHTHVYIAHRLGNGPGRLDNIEAASRLLCELADRLPIVPVASWLTLARYWPETKRDKGLTIDFAQITRCDELWLVGPELSPGMTLENAHATGMRVPSFDLVGLSVDEIVAWWERRHESELT